MIIRCLKSFAFSSIISTICLFIIEMVVRLVSGYDFSPVTPEFIALFPSSTVAMEVNVFLYGLIGMSFSAFMFIYEFDKLGLIVQNLLYCICTGIVWVPIVAFIWQLWRYPVALVYTIVSFIATYIIMTIVAYNKVKKDISDINLLLED